MTEGVKQTYVLGVDMATRSVSTPSSSQQAQSLEMVLCQQEISHLKEWIQELKQSQSLLLQEVETEGSWAGNFHSSCSRSRLYDSTLTWLHISRQASFELGSVVSDLLTHSPELYHPFQTIGLTAHRLGSNTSNLSAVEDIKSLTSLCVLLNSRYNHFRGVQLMLSLMPVARGTTKQVKYIHVRTISITCYIT